MSSADTMIDMDAPSDSCPLPTTFRNQFSSIPDTLKPLSSTQERRLTTYIDEQLLVIQREFKKRVGGIFVYLLIRYTREYESSTLKTVDAYIEAVQPILAVVLLIPPVGSSSFLRSSLLLRLTGEILDSIIGYVPDNFESILDILEELDRGWVTILRSQSWNAEKKVGEVAPTGLIVQLGGPSMQLQQTSISQTDRTRLRSLLSTGTDNLEEWIEKVVSSRRNGESITEPESLMESLRVQQFFGDLFTETLAELGELYGDLPLDTTDSEKDEYEMVS